MLAVHDAIFAALDAGVSVPVFDHVPEGVRLDEYVAMTDRDEERFALMTREGGTVRQTIQAWLPATDTQPNLGDRRALVIAAEVRSALDGVTLSLGGLTQVRCTFERSSTLSGADGVVVELTYIVTAVPA